MAHNESTGEPAGTGRDPFELIRLQDPAAGLAPDVASLRRRVAERIEADRIGGDLFEDDTVGAVPATVLDLDEARTRRSGQRRWLQVAAAAVGVMAVGLGGYLVGNGGDTKNEVALPETTVQAPFSSPADIPSVPNTTPQPGPSAMGTEGGAKTGDTKLMVGNRTVFTAGADLSNTAGTAPGWTFDPASVFSKKSIAAAAKELGVSGTPRLEAGTWSVGPVDGSGPGVQLMPDGTASLSFSDSTKDPYRCTSTSEDPATCPPGKKAPTGEAAVKQATALIGDLGVDTTTLKFTELDPMDSSLTSVQAEVLINGNPSGVSWSIGLVADGVQSLYGPLAPVVSLGDFPVISPAEAVTRLTDPRFGFTGGGPIAYDAAGAAETAPVTDPTPPTVAEPGKPIAWPVAQVTITGAELVTTSQYQPDGAVLLLPAYNLTDDAGSVWTVIAAADSAFDFSG